MYCSNCGKEINNEVAFCPECGTAQQRTTPPPGANYGSYNNTAANQPYLKDTPYNTMCIIGLVVSGISLLLNFYGLVGIAGTVLSVLGLISCKERNERGRNLAVIGIVIGAISILYGLIVIISLR